MDTSSSSQSQRLDEPTPEPSPTTSSSYEAGTAAPWYSLPPANHHRQSRSIPNMQQSYAAFSPVPQACSIPILSQPYNFQVPQKRIRSPQDIEKFHLSDSGRTFLGFIVALNDSIRGHKISDPCIESPIVKAIVEVLETMSNWVDEIPPLQQPARYGNPAFRLWQERLRQEGLELVLKLLPEEISGAVIEIFPYFADSFGSAMRIDYGTGHEVNFAAWLLCLARLLTGSSLQGLMEFGGLDDYHFLPFIFGSSQLLDHKYIKPKSIHSEEILSGFSHDYLYFSCVAFVKKVKKGAFAEHSPMMDDISGVATWAKVNSGMLKMYKADVLEKVPIMQHFLFGSIIKWE